MTKFKRIIALAGALVFVVLSVSACGGECDARDSQNWCGRDTGHGTTSYSP